MQITAPAPIIYLPENLWSLFTRPGRELVIRVIGVEGKTLFLDLGGEKFQARIGGSLNPQDFVPGQQIKVRVSQVGYPIVLQIVSEEKKETSELQLLYLLLHKDQDLPQEKRVSKDVSLLSTFLKELVEEKKASRATKETKKEKLEEFLGDKIKGFKILYEEDKVILPFIFNDEKSWGYLEIGVPEKKGKKIKLFFFKLFMEFLGMVEGLLGYESKNLWLDLSFSNKKALEEAKGELSELKKRFSFYNVSVKINLNYKEVAPGQLISKYVI